MYKSLILNIEDIWEYTDSMEQIICSEGLEALYIKADDYYVHYYSSELQRSCSALSCNMPLKSRDIIEVLINYQNDVLIEGVAVRLEDIDSVFFQIYMNPQKVENYILQPKSSAVLVKGDINADKFIVKEVIKNLIEGYTRSISSLYPKNSGEILCDSIINNQDQIEKDYPFNLQLNLGNKFTIGGRHYPPPPPPPLPGK